MPSNMVTMAEATSHSNEMNVDRIFGTLSNEYRRIILTHLLEQQSPIPIEDLVDRVVAEDTGGHAPREDLRNRVRMSLYHNHLPKLADSNMIDFDTERGLIAVKEAAYDAEPYLDLAKEGNRPG